jgi:hypothetical protein
VSPEEIEKIIACTAAAALGIVLAFLQPSFMPEDLRSLAERLGHRRKILGLVIIIVAVAALAT